VSIFLNVNFKVSLVVLLIGLLLIATHSMATVLPEERSDVMFHEYEGGGVTINGPSVLVRKNYMDRISINANYYVDNVTSASIDVLSYGSPYVEERTEQSVGIDLLRDKSIVSMSYTNSTENDYDAKSFAVGFSRDLFGDLTTVSVKFGFGDDVVRAMGQAAFEDTLTRKNYQLSVSQILTKKLIMAVNFESINEEGFLRNPYRKSSILMPNDLGVIDRQGTWEEESYPNTRTSDSASLRFKYYLPYRAALRAEYRHYSDSWEIQGSNFEIGYTHPIEALNLTFDVRYRTYQQEAAFFFIDFLDASNGAEVPTYHGRDKELAEYSTTSLGVGVKWEFLSSSWFVLDKASISLNYDHITFEYDNYRTADAEGYELGKEPLYKFDANVTRIFFTAIY